MGLAPPARHHQRDAIPIGTAAYTAIGPREWRRPTRPVLDLNSQSPSEYFSRQPGAVREVDRHPQQDHRPQAHDGDLKPTGIILSGGADRGRLCRVVDDLDRLTSFFPPARAWSVYAAWTRPPDVSVKDTVTVVYHPLAGPWGILTASHRPW
jgi:hypothetical protein